MSVGFRLLLIVLIGFCTLCVYQLREGELAVWLRNSPPPPVQSLPGESPFDGLVGNDTVIETTIRATSIGTRPHVTRRSHARWDRPSIEAGEPAVDIRRSSANTPSAPEDTEGVEARSPDLKPAEGSLNLVNPGRAGAPTIERPSAPRIGTASPGLPPEPPSEPPSEPQSKPESKPETESRPSPAKGSYTIHVVKDGDKLWNLAEKYLGKGHRFGKIIELNKEELGDNPERLRVGLKLKIPKK